MATSETASTERTGASDRAGIPFVVWLLGFTTFALATSEFMVAGMMPSLSEALGVSVADIGYLISLYAAGMVIGGPLLTALLLGLRVPNKTALLWLLALYVAGGVLAATATDYTVMAVARVITGVAGSACFGVSLSIAAGLVAPHARGKAASIVLGGLMLATVLGVPAATLVDQSFGWRASFWLVVAFAAVCACLIALIVKPSAKAEAVSLRGELAEFRKGRLWAAYATSGLIIGATFAAFSYFSPIFTDVTGFGAASIPLLLGIYGVANIVGNIVVGRYADRHIFPILIGGLVVLTLALAAFALMADNPVVAVAAFLAIGLAGVPMNPAMVARVMRSAHAGPLVNTVHTSVVNVGLAFGAWAGGLSISAGYGLPAPLWIGLVLAIGGLLSLAPAAARQLETVKR